MQEGKGHRDHRTKKCWLADRRRKRKRPKRRKKDQPTGSCPRGEYYGLSISRDKRRLRQAKEREPEGGGRRENFSAKVSDTGKTGQRGFSLAKGGPEEKPLGESEKRAAPSFEGGKRKQGTP